MEQFRLSKILSVKTRGSLNYQSLANSENYAKTIFGGQVLAQALLAAYDTVENRPLHSLHAYFLRPGAAEEKVDYEVEKLRNGNTISSRRVVASQKGRVIFHLSASFHSPEEGYSHHTALNSDIPMPDELQERLSSSAQLEPENLLRNRSGVEFLTTGIGQLHSAQKQAPFHAFWFRVKEKLPSTKPLHQAALAYASDMGLIGSALLPHPASLFTDDLQVASVDHALWLHSENFNANNWMLYQLESPWSGKGRGFAQARIYTETRELIASVAQEGVIRARK